MWWKGLSYRLLIKNGNSHECLRNNTTGEIIYFKTNGEMANRFMMAFDE